MCGFHSPFVVALAALGATALLSACGKNGGAGVPISGPEYMSGAKLEWRCPGRAHANPTAS